jgi:O-antigen/teichoic acid export membrane protein
MIKHTLIYFLSKGIPGIINFLAIAIYTRLLSPHEYGEYALVIATMSMVNATVFHWLRLGLLRFNPKYQNEKQSIFLSSLTATFVSLLMLTLIIGSSIYFFSSDIKKMASIWFLGLTLLTIQSIFDLFTEYLRSELKSILFGIVTSLKVVLSLALSIVFITIGLGSNGIILGLICGTFASIIFFLPKYVKDIRISLIDKDIIKEIITYSLPFIATLSMEYIILSSDRFIIGYFLGKEATGIYAVSYDLAKQILIMLMMIINLAAYPLVVKALEKEGIEGCQRQLNQNTTILLLIALPATVGLIMLSQPFTTIFLGEQFRGKAAIIFSFISFAIFLQGMKIYYFDLAFQLGKNTKLQIWPVLIAGLLNIMLNIFLVPQYGINGSAFSSICAYGVSIFISALIGRNIFPLTFPFKDASKIALATAIMGIVLWFIPNQNEVGSFVLQVIIGLGIYAIAVVLLNILNIRKHLKINIIINKLKKK